QGEALAFTQLEIDAIDGANHAAGRVEHRFEIRDFHTGTVPIRTRGSNPSRTASAKRLAARTSTNMKKKAAASDHQTIGSRPISRRAALIMVPKLVVAGSTPTPT